MKDNSFDELLRQVLLDAAAEDSEYGQWSVKTKMRPTRQITIALAAVLACFAIVVVTVPQARSAIIHWSRNPFGDNGVIYTFDNENPPDDPLPKYYIASLPKDFEVVYHFETDMMNNTDFYSKTTGQEIGFDYYYTFDGTNLTVTNPDGVLCDTITINGMSYEFILDGDMNDLILIDDENSIMFILTSTTMTKEQMIHYAESITKE